MNKNRFCWIAVLCSIVVGVLVAQLCTSPMAYAAGPPANAKGLERAMQVQARNTKRLLSIQGVVGTATGLSPAGQPVVKVYTAQAGVGGVPVSLEGVPVEIEVTGRFVALAKPDRPKRPAPEEIDRTARFEPVPIGVSVGNEFEWSAGTLGCRVIYDPLEDDPFAGEVCALSNLHVFDSDQNGVEWGERVFQPARLDDPEDSPYQAATQENMLGTLIRSCPIYFNGDPDMPEGWANRVDAAIAVVPVIPRPGTDEPTVRQLLTGTPADGYGEPMLGRFADARIGLKVQKYGRTTGLTKGEVSGIGAVVQVAYPTGTATFVDQIIVSGRGILKAGDSGSLLVTDPGCEAVGLMFAGPSNARYGIANPIEEVLIALEIRIDGME